MTREDAVKLLGPIAEAITLLSTEKAPKKAKKTKKEDKPNKTEEEARKIILEVEKEAEETKEDDSFFEDEATTRTPEEVKTLVIKWINESPDERRKVVQETFEKATGLAKMNLVTAENATEVYGKLEAALK